MDVVIVPLLVMLGKLISLYVWVVVIGVVLSWLTAFNVVNMSNRFVSQVSYFIFRATEPALKPIRKYMPNLGGIDISPVILIIGLMAIEQMILRLAIRIGS